MLISIEEKIKFKEYLLNKIVDSNLDLSNLTEKSLWNLFEGKINIQLDNFIVTFMKNTSKGDIYVNLDSNNLHSIKIKRRLSKLNKL